MIGVLIKRVAILFIIIAVSLNAKIYVENLESLNDSYTKSQSMGNGWVTHRYKFYASSSGKYTVNIQANREYIRMKAGKTSWKQEFFRDASGNKKRRKRTVSVKANEWVYLSVWKDDHSESSKKPLSYDIDIDFVPDGKILNKIKNVIGGIISAKTQKPFVCENAGTIISYVTSGNANEGDSNLRIINLSDGTSKSDEVLNGDIIGVNSIGYNVKDDFVWGYNIPERKIVRIGADRNIKYYEMDNAPDIHGHYYNAADIDQNGVLYMKADTTADRLDRVELDGKKEILHVLSSVALTETMYSADFAFNPVDGQIYYVDTKDGYLKRIKIEGSKGVVSPVGMLSKVYTIIAAFDSDGNFYYNDGETINKVIIKDGEIKDVIYDFSKVPDITQGDGTRCPNASVEPTSDSSAVKDYGDAPDVGTKYHYSKYAYKYDDGDPRQKISERVTPNVYLGSKVDAEDVGSFNESASADDDNNIDDEDSVSDEQLDIDISKDIYSVSVYYKNKGSGEYVVKDSSQQIAHKRYISAWIDWDNNGEFDNDELIDDNFKEAPDQSEGEVELKWSIPHELISAGDKRVMRIRLTECAYVSDYSLKKGDIISSNDCSNADNGYASFGEIEDYIVSIKDDKELSCLDSKIDEKAVISKYKDNDNGIIFLDWDAALKKGDNEVVKKSDLNTNNKEGFWDITYSNDGKLYGVVNNELYQLSSAGNVISHSKIGGDENDYPNYELVGDKDGYLYTVGAINGRQAVIKFKPTSSSNTLLVAYVDNLNLVGDGDLAWSDGYLYWTATKQQGTASYLVKIDVIKGTTSYKLIKNENGGTFINADALFNDSKGNLYFAAQDFIYNIDKQDAIAKLSHEFTYKNGAAGGATTNYAFCASSENKTPTISISDASIVEGDSGSKDMVFNVSLTKEAGTGVTFKYQIFEGNDENIKLNAKLNRDYRAYRFATSVVLEGSSKSIEIKVPIIGDREIESDEKFRVVLSEVHGASEGDLEAVGTIIDNDRADAICYATTDDSKKLFIYDNLSSSSPLSYPKTINLTRGVFGEGGAYRAVDGYIYQFNDDGDTLEDHDEDDGPSSLYKINVQNGKVDLVKEKMLTDHVDAAEFYYDKESKQDIFYVIVRDTRMLYAYNPEDWSLISGYPKKIKDQDGNHVFIGGLAIDPYSGKAYGIRDFGASDEEDENPELYELNLQTAVAKSIFALPPIDAEGLAYADDGNLYVETEDRDYDGDEDKIFKIDLVEHTLTKVSHSGTKEGGDIETLSCNAGESQAEAILSIDQKEITILEGDSNGIDGTNGKEISITITSNKTLQKDIEILIDQKSGTAILDKDFKQFSPKKIIMKKGSKKIVFSQPSVIADLEVEKDEYFTCEFSSPDLKFEKDKNSVIVKIVDNDYNQFEALDIDEKISYPFIKTKVVGKKFTLELAQVSDGKYAVNMDDDISELKAIIVDASECVNNIAQLDSSKFDNVSELEIKGESIEQEFLVNKAIRVAKVQFVWKNRYGKQASCSSDSFSIRPSSYELNLIPNSNLVAGKKFDIQIKALEDDGVSVVGNYNENSSVYKLEYDEVDKSGTCQKGTLIYSNVSFVNGIATIKDAVYSDIGKIKLTVSEVDGNEFAVIDKYDGSNSSRFITKDSILSSEFLVGNISLFWDLKDKILNSHTFYSSHPLIMGADLSTTIVAEDINHNPLKNFTKDCSYAKDLLVELDFNKNGDPGLGNPIVEYDANKIFADNVTATKLSYKIYGKSFNLGVSNANFYINFTRAKNSPLEPTRLRSTKIKVSIPSSISVTDTTSKFVTFVYGRAHVADIVGNKVINVPVDYEVYCKSCNRSNFTIINARPESRDSIYWYIIPSDINTNFGGVDIVYGGATAMKISSDQIRVTADNVPHKNIITYVPRSYLLFDRYNPAVNKHKSKTSHLSNGSTWAGKGKTGFVVDENISTSNETGSIDW